VPLTADPISTPQTSQVITCFQWSHPGLDLSTEDVAINLYFVGLPVEQHEGQWVFDALSIGGQDAVLRDFRWGTVGQCRLWGLGFQVLGLERAEFPVESSTEPNLPARIELTGILHFMGTQIRLADESMQQVRLIMQRKDDEWHVEELEGKFLWPLFEPTPDLADATRAGLTDPLPWLAGTLGLVSDGGGQALTLGTPKEPAQFVFQFLDRTWSMPVALSTGWLASPLGGESLTWQILASLAPSTTLAVTGGQITIGRENTQSHANVNFSVVINLDESQAHVLADLDLSLQILSEGSKVRLDKTSLLSLDENRSIVTVAGDQAGKVDITARQISLALNRSPGYRADSEIFELLPGWPLDSQASLQAYLSLGFVPPTEEVVSQFIRIEEFQLLIETTLATPHPLSTLIVATLRSGKAPQVSVQLTGQLYATNQLAWLAPGGETIKHHVVFTLRQATLPGEKLSTASTRAFFSPRIMTLEEDASGLSGMIELPVLASHRFTKHDQNGESNITGWVAPQQVRLGAPASFVEEVLLRGSKQLNLHLPALPRITGGLMALYTFDEGKGSSIHDSSDTDMPLDLAVSEQKKTVTWSADGLSIRSPVALASVQAASKIVDACQATNEITIEAWVKTAPFDHKDSACLIALSKNPGEGNFTFGLEWEPKEKSGGKEQAVHYHVTLRTTSTGKSKGSESKQLTGVLDSPSKTLTSELSHVVFTRDASGAARIYVDGIETASKALQGLFSGWDRQYRLTLANEPTGNQPFLGEFRLVAIYKRALTAVEVHQNFRAGYPHNNRVVYENGFAGPLGDALASALQKSTNETMIMEATEAFWLRSMSVLAVARDFSALWREGQFALAGLPTMESDFFPSNEGTTHDWSRLPLPFLTDTVGVIGEATQSSMALETAMQCTLPVAGQKPPEVDGLLIVSRESLLHRSMLDRFSLGHRPLHPGYGRPMDQVLLQPESYERLLPYTQTLMGFAPGWLVFTDWPPNADGSKDVIKSKPFSASGEVISRWISAGSDSPILVAATEVTPDIVPAELPWQQIIGHDGRPRPYLLASPLIALRQTVTAPIKKNEGWTGLQSIQDLINVNPDAIELALHWVNQLSSNELKSLVPDAPGGYSITDEGYGIGMVVAERIIGARTKDGPFGSLEALLDIRGFGIDKLSDLLFAAQRASGSDIRILVEIWVPASGDRWERSSVEPVLAARRVFRLALTADDNWETILFTGPAGGRPESSVRAKVREWVKHEPATIFSALSPLLRVTLLTPTDTLPPKAYFILTSQASASGQRPTRRSVFGSTSLLRPDLRFEALAEPPNPDPLALGPDYLGGQVYYEPRAWFEPPRPVIDDVTPGGAIDRFTAEPDLIKSGEPVILRWETRGDSLPLNLGIKDQDEVTDVTGKESLTIHPEQTAIYVLRAFSDGKPIDFREVSIVVQVPAAGSAVGMAYKLAGTAPGPAHASRLSWAEPNAQNHRWVETMRDLMYLDQTRDAASHYEPGWFLPPTRRLDWGTSADHDALQPFFPTRAIQLFTSGRPGSLMRLHTALLNEDKDGMVRRSASMAYEFRHPRPVPLPPELYPFDPDQTVVAGDQTPRRTCGVELLDGPTPFRYKRLKWQDPIFNRRLLAVGQEASVDAFVLGLDRAIYAGVDVIYPEIRFIPPKVLDEWSIVLTVSLHRKDVTGLYTLGEVEYRVTESTVNKVHGLQSDGILDGIRQANASKGIRRWIWELGLNQPAVLESVVAENDNFEFALENYDEIHVTARLMDKTGRELQNLQLAGKVRTDIEVWPQPQNAFGVLRTEQLGEFTQTDLTAFGWLPKPRVIKRGNRFNPDSWEGTFNYVDAFVGKAGSTVSYEILTITAYGEQPAPATTGEIASDKETA